MKQRKSILQSQAFSSAASSILSIVIGLLFGLIILLVSNPSQAFDGFKIILTGVFTASGNRELGQVLYFATPIIMTGLSVGFAFKTGLFNIGTPGQFVVGAFTAVFIGVKWTFLPAPWHWIVALIGAAVMGGLWALIPGLLKAFMNVNEVISSIMMNYIGMYGTNYLIKEYIYDSKKALAQNVVSTAVLPKGGLDNIFYTMGAAKSVSTVNVGIYIAVIMAVITYVVLNKTTFGYELKACGFNQNASKYAGINDKRNVVLSMVIAGALAGLGGGLLYLSGTTGRRMQPVDVLAAEGFSGIPVALLGLSNPIGIIFSGIFIAYITQGGNLMQSLDFVPEVIDIIIACIIYFSAFSLFFRKFVAYLVKGKREKKEEGK